jgi:hypothetical protein
MKGATMDDIEREQDEQAIFSKVVSDEALEVAGSASNAGVYTQFGLCTISFNCPG